MKGLAAQWQMGLALVCALGALRIAYFDLIHEPLAGAPGEDVGGEFEPLRPAIAGCGRIGYLSDLPLDADPLLPRVHGEGDMLYARAQYSLAPVVLAHADATLPLLLANFRDAAALDRLIASGAFTVVGRPARTVALLRRR